MEAEHALANLGSIYDDEHVTDVLGSQRQICCPKQPDECSYVRVVVDGLEIAYWIADEWRDDPAIVMGALFATAQ